MVSCGSESSTRKRNTKAVEVTDWETNRKDDLRTCQDQRYRRYSSGHLRPFEQSSSGATACRPSTRSGTRPSSRCRSSLMKSYWGTCTAGSSRNLISSSSWSPCASRTRFKKSEPKSYTKLKRMVARHQERKSREKHFSTRDRVAEKPKPCYSCSQKKK